jgi:tRNA-binding protein
MEIAHWRSVLLRGCLPCARRVGNQSLHGHHRPAERTVPMPEPITFGDFERVDVRVGTIVDAQPFPEARKPAYKLTIDFGDAIGLKRSSVQITVHYKPDQLIGRQVCAVLNFPPRQIGPFISEVLTLGMPDEDGAVVLIRPDLKVPNGGRMF